MLNRNLVFRVSIVINIAWLLYVAMHLSGTANTGVEWVPASVDGSERGAEILNRIYTNRDEVSRNETETRPADSSARIFEESTSQKTPAPSTLPTTNKTASSTASIVELEKKLNAVPSEIDLINETLEITDENALAEPTLTRLRSLLACTDREFFSQTIQRGEFWVLKNYVRADHGIIMCHETITYTTHAGFEFLDNVLPLVER